MDKVSLWVSVTILIIGVAFAVSLLILDTLRGKVDLIGEEVFDETGR